MNISRKLGKLLFSLGFILVLLITWFHRQNLYDWYRLRNYNPPASVVQLASLTTMTDYARHLFYVNRPVIEDKASFNQDCPNNGGEQTIILGCYHDRETGIFLYNVSDPKLAGVVQVTAAHEALHAIYDRLSIHDRNYVDGLLQDYYKHGLHDKRLLDTIAAYKKSEPDAVVNEMHSVFGTEVANLPPKLEAYYKHYFANRSKVVAYSMKYQQAFTSRQARAAALLAQIQSLAAQLGSMQAQIDSEASQLSTKRQALESERNSLDARNYNAQVDAYNAEVQQYKNLIATYNQLVQQHNQLVSQYQAITLEENQLIKAIDSRTSTVNSQ